jgi:hypothetical protein
VSRSCLTLRNNAQQFDLAEDTFRLSVPN